jgi:hypothetical protein
VSDSISATCACGAEFGANSAKAAQLWREWKRDHACKSSGGLSILDSQGEVSDETEPEFQIGFQYLDNEE